MDNKKQQKLVLGLILVLLVVIFALLNTEPTSINFGITQIKVPLILLIVILLLIGAGVAFLLGKDTRNSISPSELTAKLNQQKDELMAKFGKEKKDLERQLSNKDQKITNLVEKKDSDEPKSSEVDSKEK